MGEEAGAAAGVAGVAALDASGPTSRIWSDEDAKAGASPNSSSSSETTVSEPTVANPAAAAAATTTTDSINLTEEFLKSLKDERVLKALESAIQPKIQAVVETKLKDMQKKFSETMKCDADVVSGLSTRVERLDAYSRANNLVIIGLPVEHYLEAPAPSQSGGYQYSYGPANQTQKATPIDPMSQLATELSVLRLFNVNLGVPVTESDIASAFRMPLPKSRADTSNDNDDDGSQYQQTQRQRSATPVIVVRFASRRMRDAVYRARYRLQGTTMPFRVHINEDLTRQAHDLFVQTRKLVQSGQLVGAWTFNGTVYVQFTVHQKRGQNIADIKDLLPLRSIT